MSENNDTNKKIDDLAAAVARGFEEVHEEFASVRSEIGSIKDEMSSRFNHLDRRMDEFADHERRITRLEEKARS